MMMRLRLCFQRLEMSRNAYVAAQAVALPNVVEIRRKCAVDSSGTVIRIKKCLSNQASSDHQPV